MSNTYVYTSPSHIFCYYRLLLFKTMFLSLSALSLAWQFTLWLSMKACWRLCFRLESEWGISNKTKAENSISIVKLREMAIHWINVWALGFWCDRLHKQLIQVVSIPKRLLRAQLLAVCPSLTRKMVRNYKVKAFKMSPFMFSWRRKKDKGLEWHEVE